MFDQVMTLGRASEETKVKLGAFIDNSLDPTCAVDSRATNTQGPCQ